MKKALSLLLTLTAIGVSASMGAVLFAVFQFSGSEIVSKLAFVFVVFAPSLAMVLTLFLHAKLALTWRAAPMAFLACAASYGCTGYFAEWATEIIASKTLNRDFWAIYWVAGFAFSAICLHQVRAMWRWTFPELQKADPVGPDLTSIERQKPKKCRL